MMPATAIERVAAVAVWGVTALAVVLSAAATAAGASLVGAVRSKRRVAARRPSAPMSVASKRTRTCGAAGSRTSRPNSSS